MTLMTDRIYTQIVLSYAVLNKAIYCNRLNANSCAQQKKNS
jgi:hypothetical protein